MKLNEVISLLQTKDIKGLEKLYTEYGERLYDFAVNKWKFTEDEAWEIVYKTLETLLNKGSEYNFESIRHFENFLYKVFKNNLAQLYRTKKRNKENVQFMNMDQIQIENDKDKGYINVDFVDSNAIMDYYSKEFVAKSFPLLDQLKSALGKLKKEEQDILLLRAQNFTYGEIRKMLDPEKKENHLKVIHLRAKRKLVELMSFQSNKNDKNHGNNE